MFRMLTSLSLLSCFILSCQKSEPVLDCASSDYVTVGQTRITQELLGQNQSIVVATASFNTVDNSNQRIAVDNVLYNTHTLAEQQSNGEVGYSLTNQGGRLSGAITWEITGNHLFEDFTATTHERVPYFDLVNPQATISTSDRFLIELSNLQETTNLSIHLRSAMGAMAPIYVETGGTTVYQYEIPTATVTAALGTNQPIEIELEAYNSGCMVVDDRRIESYLTTSRKATVTIIQ